MARMGRPKKATSRVIRTVCFTPEQDRMFEELEFDPFTCKRAMGTRNTHLDRALGEYFAKYYPELWTKVLTGDK